MPKETQTLCRKVKLVPVGDKDEVNRVYKYIRDGMFNQNKAMNQFMTALYMEAIQGVSVEDRKELNKLYSRISSSKKGSAYSEDIQFPVGLPTASSVGQAVKQDFSKACKDGLLYGKISLPSYRMDNPLLVHVDWVRLRRTNPHQDMGLYHNYADHTEFLEHLHNADLEILIKFANKITFKVVFGSPHKSRYLREEFKMIFEEYYKVCGSSIQLDGKDIILNMAMEIPKKKTELNENTVVGVDLGLAVPAVVALNNDSYKREFIGDIDDFLRVRTQMRAQRSRLQRHLKMSSGGHGRKKKLQALERLKERESRFVQTYNHMVSKHVVDFALKNNAKYINVENLEGYGDDEKNKFILSHWSYYQLQQYITYKASSYGIEVRKVNPYRTSQICSCCGSEEEDQLVTPRKFVCKKCGKEMHSDFNAARNIAMSTQFSDGKKTVKQAKKQHEESKK